RKIPVRKSLPGQCILLRGSSSNPPRWPLNEVTPIRLHYQLDGPVCSDITNELNSTIDHMKENYPGLQLDYPSVLSNYSAQCSPGLEDQFSNLSSYFTSNFGDPGRTMIIFNDICDDMPPLFGNCGGVYGFAAATASGTHSFNGQSYTSLQAGFVSVNEGVPQCLCNSTDRGNSATNFVLFLAHELGHTLGLNHIVSGTANLNPNCCVDISSLDQGCINTLYPTHLNCTGHDINFANQTIPSGISLARNILRSQSNVDIANGSSVSWRAQSSIDIDGDFTIPTGSTLEVDIDNCN
ncbi:MAG: M43 family zinc metalloprotease, partial [Bacteroidota bacterium]